MLSIIPEKTRVVLIGTSKCSEGLSLLPAVSNNIKDLAKIITDSEIIGISENNIVTILDEPDHNEVLSKLLEQTRKAEDTLIVYYAGHGLVGKRATTAGKLYLAVGNSTDDHNTPYNSLAFERVREIILGESNAKKKILILDCCFSGKALQIMGNLSSFVAESIDIQGIYTITSAAANQVAIAPMGETYTAFSGKFIQALKEGIDNGKNVITLEEIYNFIYAELSKKAMPLPQTKNFLNANQIALAFNQKFTSNTVKSAYTLVREKHEKIAYILKETSVLIGERIKENIELDSVSKINPGLGLLNEANYIYKLAKDIKQGVFRVTFLGSSKVGKSTLINALIGENLLPRRAVHPATTIITVLGYGKSEDVAVYQASKDKPISLSWSSFFKQFRLTNKDITDIINQEPFNKFDNFRFAQAERLCHFCNQGIKVIDTPGFIKSTSQLKITIEFLKDYQPDAVIYVLDPNSFLVSRKEEKFFLETILNNYFDKIFFIFNIHEENEREFDEIIKAIQESFKDYLGDENGLFDKEFYENRVFFINAASALNARTELSNNTEKLKKSRILLFEEELEKFLTSQVKIPVIIELAIQVLNLIYTITNRKISQEKDNLFNQILVEMQPMINTNKRINKNTLLEKIQVLQKEKERLDIIEQRLLRMFNNVNMIAHGEPFNPETLNYLPKQIFSK